MTEKYLYLSLIPQGLISSMLNPHEFGSYYSVGSKAHIRSQAMFFEIDPNFRSDDFPFHLIDERCVPHADGSPRRSVYLSIYQVLRQIPISALKSLYLVTEDGRTLELQQGTYEKHLDNHLRLYQEFCPVTPMVASNYEPKELVKFITDPKQPVHVPRIVFSQLEIGELADDPENGSAEDLPYPAMLHLRDILSSLKRKPEKGSRMFLKQVKHGVFYRMVKGGFYVGDQKDFAFYPFPSLEELESTHRNWWRSAQILSFQ
ncbi:MAG: hypothetical protein HQM14_12495 [SAR324 cluster bacterium]|nr:hypothetical protein [SAR324 cluster bacterium]